MGQTSDPACINTTLFTAKFPNIHAFFFWARVVYNLPQGETRYFSLNNASFCPGPHSLTQNLHRTRESVLMNAFGSVRHPFGLLSLA